MISLTPGQVRMTLSSMSIDSNKMVYFCNTCTLDYINDIADLKEACSTAFKPALEKIL